MSKANTYYVIGKQGTNIWHQRGFDKMTYTESESLCSFHGVWLKIKKAPVKWMFLIKSNWQRDLVEKENYVSLCNVYKYWSPFCFVGTKARMKLYSLVMPKHLIQLFTADKLLITVNTVIIFPTTVILVTPICKGDF